ncbi:MAG: MarR family transcriptional regulator [Subdoligranulum variabile]|nr:MarR family transcriptional regulator [Subdoligranulum variabile]
MGVTKPSVTSILTSLMKQGAVVRRRYGKIYITDRGVLYARYYDELIEKILQHFPLADMGFTPEECRSAAVAMAVALPAREIDEKCEALYDNENK